MKNTKKDIIVIPISDFHDDLWRPTYLWNAK